MKNNRSLLLFFCLIVGLIIYSCKKSDQNSIQTLFTGGSWQLASVNVFHYVGNTQVSTDTLNTSCTLIQLFTFYKNNTCTYTNFDCITQSATSGQWSLTPNQLFLDAEVVCKDSTAAGSSKPFANSRIINLGQYSLILQTGDIEPNFSLTKPRKIIQYGFVRVKSP